MLIKSYETPVGIVQAHLLKGGQVVFKKLSEGEHDSPPEGYPKERSQYAVPEFYLFPIDREHIHAAISYFPKHQWTPKQHKEEAAKRILNAAKRFGIDVSKDSEVYRSAHKGE